MQIEILNQFLLYIFTSHFKGLLVRKQLKIESLHGRLRLAVMTDYLVLIFFAFNRVSYDEFRFLAAKMGVLSTSGSSVDTCAPGAIVSVHGWKSTCLWKLLYLYNSR